MRVSYSPIILILSAFLTGLAQQPLHLGWLAWFSLVPFVFVLNQAETLKAFIKAGFIWGVTYNLVVIFWLATNIGTTPIIGLISMISAVLYCSLNCTIICLIMGLLKSRYPNIWICTDYYNNRTFN